MSTINASQFFKDCGETLLRADLQFPILIVTECYGTEALMVWLLHLGEIQWRVSVTIFVFIVKLDVLTL